MSTPADPGFDEHELAIALKVLGAAQFLEEEDESYVALRRACGKFYKDVKKQRRLAKRAEVAAADRAVVETTATGSASRIDDETEGIPLVSNASGATAGTLIVARPCYICKQKYTVVDAFYHQLCPDCAALNRAKRDARTDLTGRRALLTGGRAKIGMYIALRLLRDGAHTTITRCDASRRCPTAPTGSTASASSASTCATRPRSSAWRTRSRLRGRWTS
jgi:hypothetical protein